MIDKNLIFSLKKILLIFNTYYNILMINPNTLLYFKCKINVLYLHKLRLHSLRFFYLSYFGHHIN